MEIGKCVSLAAVGVVNASIIAIEKAVVLVSQVQGIMAEEAAVENLPVVNSRFFCHKCSREISALPVSWCEYLD